MTPETFACLLGLGVILLVAWMMLRGSGPSSRQRAEAETLVRLLGAVDQELSRDTVAAIRGVIAKWWDPKVVEEVQRRTAARAGPGS